MDPTVDSLRRPSGDVLSLHRYPDPGVGPRIVILPAMGVPARYYRHLAAALHAVGFAVVAADLRGTGASTPKPSRATRYGYADLVEDVAAVCAEVADDRPLLLLGHSLGGQIGLLHAANEPAGIAGVVLVGVGIPYWRAYPGRRRYGILGMTQSIGAASGVLGVWPGWGFGGRQAGRVMTDWARTARAGSYAHLDGAEDALAKLTTPVLAISMDGDTLLPAPVMDYLLARLPAAPVERLHLTAQDLGTPVDHFTWAKPVPAARLATHVRAWN